MSWLEWSGIAFFALLYSVVGAFWWAWMLLSGRFNRWPAFGILVAGIFAGPIFWMLWRAGHGWVRGLQKEARAEEEIIRGRKIPVSPDTRHAAPETTV